MSTRTVTTSTRRRPWRTAAVGAASAVLLSGCSFSPYELPLPGGADLGSDPYTVTVQFRDVLDLVPQSAVRVDDIAVGKVTKIRLDGWTATATLKINRDVELPDNAEAQIRQTSLLGEKFVSLAPPSTGGVGQLGNGDRIPLDRSGRNPDIEEVLGAASLLLNGGGLEKTNTIVKELNKTLDGNEPEIKQLLQSTTTFVGQLDDNKADIITALEKVDNLARATQDQEGAITAALDDLPEALRVLDDQRDDLVGLLTSLDQLSDTATGVIRRSKDDTLAVLRDLEPTLRELANAGDDLATASQLIFSFPFTDAIVGGSPARASNPCTAYNPDDASTQNDATVRQNVADGACYGDFMNLDINLSLNTNQLTSLVQGLLSLGNTLVPAGATAEAPAQDETATDPAGQLVDLVEGLTSLPTDGLGSLTGSTPRPSASPSAGSSSSGQGGSGGSGICGLLGNCRVTTTSQLMAEQTEDVGRLVLGPVVSR
ncbi:MCE family protein [Aeromicrobium sp. 50.2.37]|uniref:MCE family protein n=1 Tax=Aeromicrobium sp. 50.2.37 TaxID=2969305 RepID=UPI00214FCAE7|nr:MCE family protein [Aeromicrobium sp. 50.2.37]MCR4514330.1 MCE family protein [Aeromicrobium sp. 50.2.37]